MADHALKTGSGGFEVKLMNSLKPGLEDKDSIAPDGRDFTSMCRIGWTVKDRDEIVFNCFRAKGKKVFSIRNRFINKCIIKQIYGITMLHIYD